MPPGRLHPQRAEPGAFPDPVQRPAVFCVATVLAEEAHGGAAGADETIRHLARSSRVIDGIYIYI